MAKGMTTDFDWCVLISPKFRQPKVLGILWWATMAMAAAMQFSIYKRGQHLANVSEVGVFAEQYTKVTANQRGSRLWPDAWNRI